QSEELRFVRLFTAKPHVFVSDRNPLVGRKSVTLEDLKEYPRLTYDQGVKNSFYFAEELHITADSPKNIIVSDRATLFNLLIGLDGYTISSGILSTDLNGNNIVSIPLESDERMEIGYIITTDRPMNAMTERYLEHLDRYIENYPC
ncbi:MAG: LysR family transcriptional regulator substrate-binding protein, partial [Ruminococcus sp.]|nr:LysR family transcriptional regulator substrate-binding protein [Ruminococcus sp.]